MGGHSREAHEQSTACTIIWLIAATIASIIFAIIFIAIYVMLSDYQTEEIDFYRMLFKIADKHLDRHLNADINWVLDATVAVICLFLILEDAFLLYELNCELHALNSTAHLSLREALEIDNRYLKDAIILEAKESQDEPGAGAAKSNRPQEQNNDFEDDDDTVKISKMMSRPKTKLVD